MSISWQNPALVVSIMVLLASSLTCGTKDPVSLLMADLEEAAEARDVSGIEKRLAPGFSGNDEINREEALALLRRYFAAYVKIRLDVTNMERAKKGDRLNFRVSFSGQRTTVVNLHNLENLLPSTAAYYFELRLVQEEGMLRVHKAYWQETSNF